MLETVKANPLKTAAATVLTIVALMTGGWKVDDRYAHAEELRDFRQNIAQQITSVINNTRKKQLEDQLFTLDFLAAQRTLVPLEQAQKARIERELRDMKK